jgi:hypothetical protein
MRLCFPLKIVALLIASCASCTPSDRDIERQGERDIRTLAPLREVIQDFHEAHARWPKSLKEIAGFAAARGRHLDLSRIESIELRPTALGTHGDSSKPDAGVDLSYSFRSRPGLPGGGGGMLIAPRDGFGPAKVPDERE